MDFGSEVSYKEDSTCYSGHFFTWHQLQVISTETTSCYSFKKSVRKWGPTNHMPWGLGPRFLSISLTFDWSIFGGTESSENSLFMCFACRVGSCVKKQGVSLVN
jgi:hypothetical protein